MKLKRSYCSLPLVSCRANPLQLKSGLISGVASLEGDNFLEFCYIASQCIWNLAWWQVVFGRSGLIKGMVFVGSGLIKGMVFGGSGLIKGMVFGRSGLIKGMVFGGNGLIKGMVFGGSGLIRGGLFISMINFFSLESCRYIVYLHLNSWLIEQVWETYASHLLQEENRVISLSSTRPKKTKYFISSYWPHLTSHIMIE